MSSNPKDPKEPLSAEEIQALIARLRAIANEFPEDEDAVPLTPSELRLVSTTPMLFLEKCALFADSHPAVGKTLDDDLAGIFRKAVTGEIHSGGVIAEANFVVRRAETHAARLKLRAAKLGRELYRLDKSFITTDAGDIAKERVEEMQSALQVKSRRRLIREAKARATKEAAETAAAEGKEVKK